MQNEQSASASEHAPSAAEQVVAPADGEPAVTTPKAAETVESVKHFAERLFGEESWASQPVLGNPVAVWIAAIALGVAVSTVFSVARRIAHARVKKWSAKTANHWDDLVAAILGRFKAFFTLALGVYAGALLLALPSQVDHILRLLLVLAFAIQAAILAGVVVEFAIERILTKGRDDAESDAGREALKTSVGVMKFLALVVVYTVIALVALDNLGVDVTAMVASLGIGGIAIALAVQSIVGDLFGSMTIVLDKPFEVGDFIIVGDKMGTVEKVGLKTTRVRALSGEQLVFSNSDLLSSRIQNYKRMQERRAVFTIGVTYDTDYEQLTQIAGLIKSIIEAEPNARHDRTHFARFADSWLEFECVYFVKKPDMNIYLDTQQSINLKLVKAFRERGVEFAFPTQTLWHEGLPKVVEAEVETKPRPQKAEAESRKA